VASETLSCGRKRIEVIADDEDEMYVTGALGVLVNAEFCLGYLA
jgi:hypothetical protein